MIGIERKTTTMEHWTYSESLIPQAIRLVRSWLTNRGCTEIDIVDMAGTTDDQKYNTDLHATFTRDGKRHRVCVAVRFREWGKYWRDYGDEITIRALVPSDQQTELGKILEGWGDLMFYAHEQDGKVRAAKMVSLRRLSKRFAERLPLSSRNLHRSPDGTYFLAIDLSDSEYRDALLTATCDMESWLLLKQNDSIWNIL